MRITDQSRQNYEDYVSGKYSCLVPGYLRDDLVFITMRNIPYDQGPT